jgi:hypothetical protein
VAEQEQEAGFFAAGQGQPGFFSAPGGGRSIFGDMSGVDDLLEPLGGGGLEDGAETAAEIEKLKAERDAAGRSPPGGGGEDQTMDDTEPDAEVGQRIASLRAQIEAVQAFGDSAVLGPALQALRAQLEAELLEREAEAQPSADPRLAAGGELWRRRLWRRLQRRVQAREELVLCDALGRLLGVNADVVLHAVFDAGHDARTVVEQLRRYYDENPQDAEAEVGVLPLWLEHTLASVAAAAKRRAEAEMPNSEMSISESSISAAAFSYCASVAVAGGKPAPGKTSGSGGGLLGLGSGHSEAVKSELVPSRAKLSTKSDWKVPHCGLPLTLVMRPLAFV